MVTAKPVPDVLRLADERLDRIIAARPQLDAAGIAEVVGLIVARRDELIARARASGHAAGLPGINALLSLAFSIEFSLDGIQWDRVEAVSRALKVEMENGHL